MNIRQLELVDVLARTGSLARAALELGTTAPGAKRMLDNLEHETGLVLFSRSNRGVVLTTQGREFLSHAKKALAELRDGVASAARMEPEPAHLHIVEVHGYQYYIPYNCFSAALASFKGARPDVDVSIDSISCMESPRSDSLYIGALDEGDVVGLDRSEIHRVQMYGLISPCDPLAEKACLELADLEGRSILAMSRCYLPLIDAPIVPFLDAQGDSVHYRGLDDTDARFLSACLVDGSVVLSAGVPPSVASSLVAVPLEGYAFRVVVFTHPSAPEWVGEYIKTAQGTFWEWYHGQPVGMEPSERG